MPGSWHIHVLFPNPHCPNCTEHFTKEHDDFSFAGALELRGLLAATLNRLTEELGGRSPQLPIDAAKAGEDPMYDTCESAFGVFAGNPANYMTEPCIFFIDAVMLSGGPFRDPTLNRGYPNFSFFLPGATWLPGLKGKVLEWSEEVKKTKKFSQYTVLVHPNSGCLVRDHFEASQIYWSDKGVPLYSKDLYSCNAVGCNEACPKSPSPPQPLPANCSWAPPSTILI